jgi:hypothetical protein
MNSRTLLRFILLALASVATWMVANFSMHDDSEARSTIIHVAYPVAVLAGAAVLTGLAQRTRPLLTRTGTVSVFRFCGTVVLVLAACFVGVTLGQGLLQLLCWYVAFTSTLAALFILLLRGGTQRT